jgi:hypothetical protein
MLSYKTGNIRSRIWTLDKDISEQLADSERKVPSRMFERNELPYFFFFFAHLMYNAHLKLFDIFYV